MPDGFCNIVFFLFFEYDVGGQRHPRRERAGMARCADESGHEPIRCLRLQMFHPGSKPIQHTNNSCSGTCRRQGETRAHGQLLYWHPPPAQLQPYPHGLHDYRTTRETSQARSQRGMHTRSNNDLERFVSFSVIVNLSEEQYIMRFLNTCSTRSAHTERGFLSMSSVSD